MFEAAGSVVSSVAVEGARLLSVPRHVDSAARESTRSAPSSVAVLDAKLLEVETQIERLLLAEYLLDGEIADGQRSCVGWQICFLQKGGQRLFGSGRSVGGLAQRTGAGRDIWVVVRPQEPGHQDGGRRNGHLKAAAMLSPSRAVRPQVIGPSDRGQGRVWAKVKSWWGAG